MRRRRRRTYKYRTYSFRDYNSRAQRRKRRRTAAIVCAVVLLAAVCLCVYIFFGSKWQDVWNREDGMEAGVTESEGAESTEDGFSEDLGEEEEDHAREAFSESVQRERVKVKGIYVTGLMAGSGSFQDLIALVDETELNTMVIDVKDDEGRITYEMDLESVRQIGAESRYIRDMEGLMRLLKEHQIYTIARIVCFKDPYLAENRPELALEKPDGTPVTDANGLAWVNPYREEVWEYLTEVAKAAADAGFDEIQFDYVRFPIGSDADAADYGVDMQSYTRQQAITNFLTYAAGELGAVGVPVTADVFGTIIGSSTDKERTGQDYPSLGSIIDVLCPMVYPSHYGSNVFGLDVPDAHPYETVYRALLDSQKELSVVPEQDRAVVRPWLQAFTASWVDGYISYGGDQIRQQIQAVYDAGYEEWILWNASNRYSAEGLSDADT